MSLCVASGTCLLMLVHFPRNVFLDMCGTDAAPCKWSKAGIRVPCFGAALSREANSENRSAHQVWGPGPNPKDAHHELPHLQIRFLELASFVKTTGNWPFRAPSRKGLPLGCSAGSAALLLFSLLFLLFSRDHWLPSLRQLHGEEDRAHVRGCHQPSARQVAGAEGGKDCGRSGLSLKELDPMNQNNMKCEEPGLRLAPIWLLPEDCACRSSTRIKRRAW